MFLVTISVTSASKQKVDAVNKQWYFDKNYDVGIPISPSLIDTPLQINENDEEPDENISDNERDMTLKQKIGMLS